MKKTAKIVLMSVLTIAMCVSLIAGATFALFTSDDSVNIAVSSGKVNIKATVGTPELYTNLNGKVTEMKDEAEIHPVDEWTNGGKAILESDGSITLENMTPGDGVKFSINVTNNSNVAIMYKASTSCVDGYELYSMLETSFKSNGEDLKSWTKIGVDENGKGGAIAPIDVTIELPESVGKEGQGLLANILVTVTAVQGNAQTFDSDADFIAAASKGGNITLLEDMDVTSNGNETFANAGVLLDNGVDLTVDGGDHVITFDHTAFNYYTPYEPGMEYGYNQEGALSGNLTFKNVHFKSTNPASSFVLTLGIGSTANVTFENCVFENMYSGVYFNQNEGTASLTISNCHYINTTWGYSVEGSLKSVSFDATHEGLYVKDQEDFNASKYITAGEDAAANGLALAEAIKNASDGAIIYLSAGTYSPTEKDARQFGITADNVHIVGAGVDKTIIDTGDITYDTHGFMIGGDNCSISDLTIKTSGMNSEANIGADALKVSQINDSSRIVKNITITNVVLSSVYGNGLNLHGVENAIVDNVTVVMHGKCGIAMTMATDVTLTNVTTSAGGWGDIGMMYSAKSTDPEFYRWGCSVTIDFASCNFGNGVIYSERSVANDLDVITNLKDAEALGWTYASYMLEELAWTLTK